MLVSNNIDEVIGLFLLGKTGQVIHQNNNVEIISRKAGIWQGIDSYKDMNMLIIRDVNLEINIPNHPDDLADISKPDKTWAEKHFKERISGFPFNPGEAYKVWPYAKFDEDNDPYLKGKKFDHSYMERFWPKLAGNVLGIKYDKDKGINNSDKKFFFTEEQKPLDGTHPNNMGIRFEYGDYSDVVKQLTDNPLTRQAYLPIFFPEDTGAKNNIRVPCTLGYLFEIFDNKLDITYYIRSCDVYRHFRNDIYMAGRLLQHTKNLLLLNNMKHLQTGKLIMKINNLHMFENDIYATIKKEKSLKNGR